MNGYPPNLTTKSIREQARMWTINLFMNNQNTQTNVANNVAYINVGIRRLCILPYEGTI